MKRRYLLMMGVAWCPSGNGASLAAETPDSGKPNIILVIGDGQGWDDEGGAFAEKWGRSSVAAPFAQAGGGRPKIALGTHLPLTPGLRSAVAWKESRR